MSDDAQFGLDVFNAQVDAACKLAKAQSEYNQAAIEILQGQIRCAASALRVQQLSQALKEFGVAFRRCRRKLALAERRASRVAHATQAATRLLSGCVPDDMCSLAWRGFWQLYNLSSIACHARIGALHLESGSNACAHFRETLEVPPVDSPHWHLLVEMCEILAADAQSLTERLQQDAASAETALAELRQVRWDQTATVGIKPLGDGE